MSQNQYLAARSYQSHDIFSSTAPTNVELKNRNGFRGDCIPVNLSGIVLADSFETKLARYYQDQSGKGPVLFDFADAEYIEIAALVNCIATLTYLKGNGIRSFLGFPKEKSLRDFLRVWRFLEAASEATGMPVENLLLPEDRTRVLNEPQITYTGIGSALDVLEYDPDWTPCSNTNRSFFEFITFRSPTGKPISPDTTFVSAPRCVSAHWTGPLIKQVLGRHLHQNSPREEVARVIIYEAMSNAIRHPEAHLIQVVSKFDRKGRTSSATIDSVESNKGTRLTSTSEGSLRICIWDDGQSIADTLLPLVKSGRPIRAFHLPPYMSDRIFVQIRSYKEEILRETVVDQTEEITLAVAHEPHLLLASLYPGVSRSIATSVAAVEPFDGQDTKSLPQLSLSAPGMGLYALSRTVLAQFQGQLLIRSGNYRLLLESAHDAYRKQYNVQYKCKITRYPESFPPFKGNLLTIQLPIKHHA